VFVTALVKEILGEEKCIADAKKGVYPDRCYGETPGERTHIMGGGASIGVNCAAPWLDEIARMVPECPKSAWRVTRDMNTPPRKMPLGATLVGPAPT
jgi:hypothetical protein